LLFKFNVHRYTAAQLSQEEFNRSKASYLERVGGDQSRIQRELRWGSARWNQVDP
jgi:hypothetical protein